MEWRDQGPDATPVRSDWRLLGWSLLAFWSLHLAYRVAIALLGTDLDELRDPALWTALSFGFVLSVALCLVLRVALRRGLAFGLVLAAILSLPVSLVYASVELSIFLRLSPQLNRESSSRTLPDGTVVTTTAAGDVTYRQRNGRVASVKLPPIRKRVLDQAPRTIAANTTGWYFFYFGLGALFVGLASAERLRRAERRADAFQRLAQESQLRALRYQVNPHFLFNTLNSLSALVMTDRSQEAETMILNMAAFLRSTLALDPTRDIDLSEELVLQRLYLDIERGRFPDRLRVEIDVAEALLAYQVPALILQPLVENAIKYGVALSQQPVAVRIAAALADGRLVLTVENDCFAGPCAAGTGVGLINVAERLAARFGGDASCASSRESNVFRVVLAMPAVRE